MSKASPIQSSFNAGELSPQLRGRVDIDKYANGCSVLENFIPQVHGPARKRPGTRFVNEVKDSTHNCRLISFQYSTEQAYILEFGNQYVRFYMDGGVILDGPSPYEIVSPYLHTELTELHYAQSADVMYISHPNHPPYKLSRYGHTNWTLEEVVFDRPPFDDENTGVTTITASAVTGTGITLTASASLFAATDVGNTIKFSEVIESKYDLWASGVSIAINDYRLYGGNLYQATSAGTTGTRAPIHKSGIESDGAVSWAYIHDGSGYVKITAFTSATVVTADVVDRLPDSTLPGTYRWAIGAWSDTKGYPKTVVFYEDRLWFAGSLTKPQTLWASASGDYQNHKYGTADDAALNYTINSQEVNTIEWLVPGKVLMIGTSGGEFIVSGGSAEQAVTPTNVRITPQTLYGGKAALRPFRIGDVVLFVQRSGKKIREFTYSYQSDAYVAPNLTILSEHITAAGIKAMDYQQEPGQIVWVIDNNGQLLALVYERAEQVVGWCRCPIAQGSVESIATIPHWDGDEDSTWVVVNRTINGSTVRYIEYLEKYTEDSTGLFLDCALTYDGTAATTITGLDHLEGETVSILADGYVHPNRTVTSGQITLQKSASLVNIGLQFNATLVTMPVNAGARDGTSQGKTSRINDVVVRLHQTGPGLWYGGNTTEMDEYNARSSNDLMDNPVPLYTGDTEMLTWPKGYDFQNEIALQHRTPLPCTIIAIMPQVTTYDR